MLKKYILPTILIILSLALLLSGAAFFLFLTQYDALHPSQTVAQQSLSVVLLDDVWAAETFATETPEAQQEAMEQTLDAVQKMGGNAVALTARMPNGDAIFRDKTETLTTHANITKTDHFFAKFDALNALVFAATERELEVLLLPTDKNGQVLADATLDALPAWASAIAKRHSLRVLTQNTAASNADAGYTAYCVLDATATATGTTQVSEQAADQNNDNALYYVTSNPEKNALALTQNGTMAQLVLGNYYDILSGQTPNMQLFVAYYANGEALPDLMPYLGSDYARTLAVTYPVENNETVKKRDLFLMGTSNPDAPLTMDGTEVARHGTQGVWGVLVTLAAGDNTFTFANGTDTLTYQVYCDLSGGGGGGGTGEQAGYYDLPDGQTIQITAAIASALSNAYSASTITQTFYQGAVVGVTRYVSYAGRTDPYAYQLTNGDWVRASYCALSDTTRMALQQAESNECEETNASVITIPGGTPAVYHSWQDGTLTLTLMTADYAGSVPTSDWFDCAIGLDGNHNTVFTFTFAPDAPLYGWAVNYNTQTNATAISLKRAPILSENATLPLTGVRVLLDAGHGLDDLGAMGAAGKGAPCEKHVNLALTMATKYRLEQLGATVLLTRNDDSFPTLGDRVTALNTLHPDFFISVHHNSLELVRDLNEATGVEAYWFYGEGEAFANDLITAVSDAANRNLRSANYGYYYVTRSNICPATLLEVGFMTNPWEYESLANQDIIWAEAGAIAQTIYETVAANSVTG